MTLVVMQAINTAWTKVSRGALRAALRETVPVALAVPIPTAPTEGRVLVAHEVRYAEGNNFQAPISSTFRSEPLTTTIYIHNLAIGWAGEHIRIDLAWENGAPWRRFAHEIMTLEDGQWGRVRLNYRSAYEDTWRYDHWVLNLGLLGAPQPDIFRDTQPMKDFADLVDLW